MMVVTELGQTERLETLTKALGHDFHQPELLLLSLTHKSYANEKSGGVPTVQVDNERLEFLGDAVLDLALSDCLMNRFPTDSEGSLSKKRASLVNEDTLSKLALELQLESLIRLGKGEIKTGGLQKPRILASSFEAILGAVYQDAGFAAVLGMVNRLFATRIEEVGSWDVDFRHDYKTRLQEKMQEIHKSTPTYKVEAESGPDHDKQFEVSVRLDGVAIATGNGRSKKAAEQDAARKALEQVK
jgi:ribonuclease-3